MCYNNQCLLLTHFTCYKSCPKRPFPCSTTVVCWRHHLQTRLFSALGLLLRSISAIVYALIEREIVEMAGVFAPLGFLTWGARSWATGLAAGAILWCAALTRYVLRAFRNLRSGGMRGTWEAQSSGLLWATLKCCVPSLLFHPRLISGGSPCVLTLGRTLATTAKACVTASPYTTWKQFWQHVL